MKLLIIGGTGKTGRELINQALQDGHSITALVRNPLKLKIEHSNLNVVKGNVLDLESLKPVIKDQDAVISSLGHKKFFIKTSILSRGTKNIITSMENNQVKRFICITSLGINDSKYKLGLYYTLFTIPFILFFYFRDKSKQEKLIVNSTLDWTIIRPGQLTNGKKRGIYKHGLNLGHYILTKMVSRADVAHFIINLLNNKKYIKQAVGITN